MNSKYTVKILEKVNVHDVKKTSQGRYFEYFFQELNDFQGENKVSQLNVRHVSR